MWNEKVKIRIWIWIEIGRKGYRSFGPILMAIQIQIKILKKDLDPGFSDPFVRSSNSLVITSIGGDVALQITASHQIASVRR